MERESYEKKLYIPRDLEGEPNVEALKQIREFERHLEKHPAFIGIAVHGSVAKGYGRNYSDIDIKILYDSSQDSNTVDACELEEAAKTARVDLLRQQKREINFELRDIHPSAMIHDLHFDNPDALGSVVLALVDVSRIVTGEKIYTYRQRLAQEIQKLPQEKKNNLFNRMLDILEEEERYSISKLHARTRAEAWREGEEDNLVKARRELWEKRLERIWDKK